MVTLTISENSIYQGGGERPQKALILEQKLTYSSPFFLLFLSFLFSYFFFFLFSSAPWPGVAAGPCPARFGQVAETNEFKGFGLAWDLDTCKSVDVGPFIFHFLDSLYFFHFSYVIISLFFSTQESAFLSSEKSISIFINECSPPLMIATK